MFLCKKCCDPEDLWRFDLFASYGPCEDCGKKQPCADVRLAPKTPSTAQGKVMKRPTNAEMALARETATNLKGDGHVLVYRVLLYLLEREQLLEAALREAEMRMRPDERVHYERSAAYKALATKSVNQSKKK